MAWIGACTTHFLHSLPHILASMMITIEMQLYVGHPPNIHLDVQGYVGGGRWRENENGYHSDRAGGHPPNIHLDVRGYVGGGRWRENKIETLTNELKTFLAMS